MAQETKLKLQRK